MYGVIRKSCSSNFGFLFYLVSQGIVVKCTVAICISTVDYETTLQTYVGKWFIAVFTTFKAVVSRRSILKYRKCAKNLNFDFVFRYFKPKKIRIFFVSPKE